MLDIDQPQTNTQTFGYTQMIPSPFLYWRGLRLLFLSSTDIAVYSVTLGRYHSSSAAKVGRQNHNDAQTEQNTIEQIVLQEKTAASIVTQLKLRNESVAVNSLINKGVLGIVATLAKVHDDNLSRFASFQISFWSVAELGNTHNYIVCSSPFFLDCICSLFE